MTLAGDPFAPRYLLFLDGSATSGQVLSNALDGDVSVRVIPADETMKAPSMGLIGLDVVRTGQGEVNAWIQKIIAADSAFAEKWGASPLVASLPKMPDEERSMWDKVRLVRDLAALWDYRKILAGR